MESSRACRRKAHGLELSFLRRNAISFVIFKRPFVNACEALLRVCGLVAADKLKLSDSLLALKTGFLRQAGGAEGGAERRVVLAD